MTLLSDKQLKSLKPQDRQNKIIEGLDAIRFNKLAIKDVPKMAIQLMKLYLLEKGESIDVDFTDKSSNKDPDSENMIRDDVFYSDFSERIKNIIK